MPSHFVPLIDALKDNGAFPALFSLCVHTMSEESELFRSAPMPLLAHHGLGADEIHRLVAANDILSRMIDFDCSCERVLGEFQVEMEKVEKFRGQQTANGAWCSASS